MSHGLVQQRTSENGLGGIEVVRDNHSHEDDLYLPLPSRRPNRGSALIEDHIEDEINIPSLLLSGEEEGAEHPTFHPALKAAILAEGQEAMWVEDEASTIVDVTVIEETTSNVLKPSENVDGNNKQSKPTRRSSKFWFGTHKRSEQENAQDETKAKENNLPKITIQQVRKKKIKKAVVLLPQLQQQGINHDEGAKALVEENIAQEAAVNMVKARHLLHKALVSAGTPGSPGTDPLVESEKMAKIAFAHATAARRLMAVPEDGPDLDEILHNLSEQGEQAAHQHQRVFYSQSFEDINPNNEPKQKQPPTKNGKFASKAIQYLESILPKNVDKNIERAVSDDIWTEDGLSTLGFHTDTFEYNLDEAPSKQVSTNLDLVSLSSLNEILDGPLDKNGENKPPSPRQALPIICVPQRQTRRAKTVEEKAIDQAASKHEEKADDTENINAKANGLVSVVKKQKKKGLSHFLSKSTGGGEEDPNAPADKSKPKWKVLGTLLGRRQRSQIDSRLDEDSPPAENVSDNDEDQRCDHSSLESEIIDVPAKTKDDYPSISDQQDLVIQEKSSSRSSNSSTDDEMMPSIQAKSMNSDIEKNSRNDRYGVDGDLKRKNEPAPVNMKNLNTTPIDWDETVHLHPSQSQNLQVNTSSDKRVSDETVSPLTVQKKEEPPVLSQSKSDESQGVPRVISTEGEIRSSASNERNSDEKRQLRPNSAVRSRRSEPLKQPLHQNDESGRARKSQGNGEPCFDPRVEEYKRLQAMKRSGYRAERSEESKVEPGGNLVANRSLDDHGLVKPHSNEQMVDEAKPKPEDDSLINFVISPGRMQLPFEKTETTHLMNAAKQKQLPPQSFQLSVHQQPSNASESLISKQSKTTGKSMASNDSKKIQQILSSNSKHDNKNKIMSRITGIFGGKSKEKAQTPEMSEEMSRSNIKREKELPKEIDFDEKNLEQAISDGNMKAFEANDNAEKAPRSKSSKTEGDKASNRCQPKSHPMKGRPVSPIAGKRVLSRSSLNSSDSSAHSEEALEKSEESVIIAIKKGSSKAEETNIDSGEAPILQHLRSLQKKSKEERKRGRDGRRNHHSRDRMRGRRQSSLERPHDNPKTRKDPINEDEVKNKNSIPTPRRANAGYDDNFLHQKTVTARLYGSEAPRTKSKHRHTATKQVYIGDLVDSKSEISNEETLKSHGGARKKPVDPSVCGDRLAKRRPADP